MFPSLTLLCCECCLVVRGRIWALKKRRRTGKVVLMSQHGEFKRVKQKHWNIFPTCCLVLTYAYMFCLSAQLVLHWHVELLLFFCFNDIWLTSMSCFYKVMNIYIIYMYYFHGFLPKTSCSVDCTTAETSCPLISLLTENLPLTTFIINSSVT